MKRSLKSEIDKRLRLLLISGIAMGTTLITSTFADSVVNAAEYRRIAPPTALSQASEPENILLQAEGVLEDGDLVLDDGSLYDEISFQGNAGDVISATLESLHFNTYLIILDENGETIAENNDIDSSIVTRTRNSWASLTLPTDGTYRIIVNTNQNWESGNYRLTVASGQAPPILSNDALRQAEANQLLDRGIQAFESSQFREALVAWKAALDIFTEVGSRASESIALSNVGSTHRYLGEYQKAIESHEKSLNIASAIGDSAGEGAALNNLGTVYDDLGEYQKAIDVYEQALTINHGLEDKRQEAQTLVNIGVSYNKLGEFRKAIEFHQQSLATARDVENRAGEGAALLNLGVSYRNLGQYEEAADLYNQSLSISREIENRLIESNALANLGNLSHELGDYQKAINFHQQDLKIAQEIGDRGGEGISWHNLGTAFFESRNYEQAEIHWLSALNVFESLRAGGLTESQRISLVETQLNSFQGLQRTLIEQGKLHAGLEIAERGRASVFLEELTTRLGSNNLGQLEETSLPDISQIQKIAREQNATLVEYSVILDEEIYIWVVQPTGEVAFRRVSLQDKAIELADIVESARHSMGVSRLVDWGSPSALSESSDPEQFHRHLQALYEILIDPIADLLPKDSEQSIVFIPQGELFLVPFAALQNSDGKYLIDQHTVLTAPSIRILESTRNQRQQLQQANRQDILVVGNPTMPSLTLALGEAPISLDPLPGAEQEATKIAEALDVAPLLGDKATELDVAEKMRNSRIIHLATHGLLNERQGLSSGVVLAATGTASSDDGLLTAAEIAQMELNAELAVLSACNTGQGRITGDGVVGLSRSLILAGVPSVVVSLWAVPDQPTGELMVEFYKQMEKTDNKAQALRQAMLNIREQYPDPIAWAGFTLIGEAE